MISNIVKKDIVREVQREVLSEIKDALLPSFGPMGSTTTLEVANKLTQYTKDGHTILKHLSFKDPIECTVRDDLEELTTYIVKTVGDGTTSAIILSKYIFDEFMKLVTDSEEYAYARIGEEHGDVEIDYSGEIEPIYVRTTFDDDYEVKNKDSDEKRETDAEIYKNIFKC